MNIQHGDVLLKSVSKLPMGIKRLPRTNGQLVVMKGETTGHAHIITETGASLMELERNGVKELYLEVTTPVTITHDEHKPLPIPPGIYQVGQVKEYDFIQEMERLVID